MPAAIATALAWPPLLAVSGRYRRQALGQSRGGRLGVVLAAHGYPEAPRKGDVIDGIPPEVPECVTFHAGTRVVGGTLQASGGRVLCVVGLGDSVKMAQKQAYEPVDQIHFNGAQFRRDIGWRAIARERG